jgi:hypothetical protein
MTCREWLSQNAYEDVVSLIDEAMAKMASRGSKQRRNWWQTLAGGVNGKALTVEGILFPVLQAAQRHEKKLVTRDAICRNPDEKVPPVRKTGRWPRKRRRGAKRSADSVNI